MDLSFQFQFFGNIHFGSGARFRVPEVLEKNSWHSIAAVVDGNLAKVAIVSAFLDDLRKHAEVSVLECLAGEPTYDDLEAMRQTEGPLSLDAVMGIGGGSALDLAKGVAVLYRNKKPAIDYRGFDRMTEQVLPIIALPTTAGTGSEITPNASFVDAREKRKMGINGEAVRPTISILDPELTLSCPPQPTLSAAVDSVVHGIEAFVAKKTNPMARFFAKEGIDRVLCHLSQLITDPDDLHLREQIMFGAFLSAIALMNSGTGPAAALSYPSGVHLKVPHGIGGGIFLPYIIRHNINHGFCGYGELSEINGTGTKESAEAFLDRLTSIWKNAGVPNTIQQWGFNKDLVELFSRDTLDLQGALDQNPVPFGANEVATVLWDQLDNGN